MIKKFIKIVKELNLPKSLTLAFSGGVDSRVLLDLLIKARFEVELAYFNHKIRRDFKEEENFIDNLAKNLNLKLTKSFAKTELCSESEARIYRYQFLDQFETVVMGHHMDDNVETFMFRLLRGSSFKGLKSIPIVRNSYYRPMLNFTKKEILDYAFNNNLEYYEDYTNAESRYTRNYMRNEIFPLMENINPKFREKINSFIKELQRIETNYDSTDMKRVHFEFFENGTSSITVKGGVKLYKSNGVIKIVKPTQRIEPLKLELNKKIVFFDYEIELEEAKEIVKNSNVFYTNVQELYVRQRLAGDYFYPSGMQGKKSLKKFLIEKKIDRFERDKVPIICFEDKIVWVAPIRGSRIFQAGKDEKLFKISVVKL